MTQDNYSIFISYASPDQARVLPFYDYLEDHNLNPWIDCRKLKPGQNWDFEIKRALDKATFVMAFVSSNSFDRRGYIQRELKLALDKLPEKLIDDIYLIPVLLDDNVLLPDAIKKFQFVRANDPAASIQIIEAIHHQLQRLGIQRTEAQEEKEISWLSHTIKEAWDGIPGYEVELEYLELRSTRYPNISQISDYIKGTLLLNLFQHRSTKLSPSPEIFNYGQDRFIRTNTYDAHCREPVIVGKLITFTYSIHWYGAGAAHPNQFFRTFAFLLEPITLIEKLSDIFQEPDVALRMIQIEVRQALEEALIANEPNTKIVKQSLNWINEGTETWESLQAFVFDQEGLELLFGPYQVASYADGPQVAKVPYNKIVSLMRNEFTSAFGIEHYKWHVSSEQS